MERDKESKHKHVFSILHAFQSLLPFLEVTSHLHLGWTCRLIRSSLFSCSLVTKRDLSLREVRPLCFSKTSFWCYTSEADQEEDLSSQIPVECRKMLSETNILFFSCQKEKKKRIFKWISFFCEHAYDIYCSDHLAHKVKILSLNLYTSLSWTFAEFKSRLLLCSSLECLHISDEMEQIKKVASIPMCLQSLSVESRDPFLFVHSFLQSDDTFAEKILLKVNELHFAINSCLCDRKDSNLTLFLSLFSSQKICFDFEMISVVEAIACQKKVSFLHPELDFCFFEESTHSTLPFRVDWMSFLSPSTILDFPFAEKREKFEHLTAQFDQEEYESAYPLYYKKSKSNFYLDDCEDAEEEKKPYLLFNPAKIESWMRKHVLVFSDVRSLLCSHIPSLVLHSFVFLKDSNSPWIFFHAHNFVYSHEKNTTKFWRKRRGKKGKKKGRKKR